MAVRIRVYPQTGALGMNGYGGAVSANTYYNSKLQSQKQVSNLQLGYERALADERINRVRLEERLKNPYLQNSAAFGAFGGLPMMGAFGGLPLGGLPLGGVPIGGVPMGGFPIAQQLPMAGLAAMGRGGQTNITNQTSTGGAAQSVTNSNVNNVSHVARPMVAPGGWGGGYGFPTRFGGGGLLSGLLGALI